MANIWENAISILVGNLNSSLSYLTTTVSNIRKLEIVNLLEEGACFKDNSYHLRKICKVRVFKGL